MRHRFATPALDGNGGLEGPALNVFSIAKILSNLTNFSQTELKTLTHSTLL